MTNIIETPPEQIGTEREQLRTLYSYLFRLSEALNVALTAPGNGQAIIYRPSEEGGYEATLPPGSSWEGLGASYNELKSLIINTAEIINQTIDKEVIKLNQQTTAISQQFGTFQETIGSTITATAESVVQSYQYDARLDAIDEQNAGFSAYKVKTEGFIRSGFIDYDAYGVPIIGIAIGQGLKSVKVTIDGTEYEKFDAAQSCAFYTAERVSFRVQGQEVAYISNRKMYIRDVEITGTAIFGGWEFSHANGLTIKWIGE